MCARVCVCVCQFHVYLSCINTHLVSATSAAAVTEVVTYRYNYHDPGIQKRELVENLSLEDWNKIVSVLLTAPFQLIRLALPCMKRKGNIVLDVGIRKE